MAVDPQTGQRLGNDEIMRRLSALSKVRPTREDIEGHVARLKAESDRGVMILAATMIEDALLTALGRLLPHANASVRKELFSNDGPLSTFSKRILFAHGAGLISATVAKQMNVIRRIRNVAAHAHAAVDFSLPEVVFALATMLPDRDMVDDFETWPQKMVRNYYLQICGYLADHLIGGAGGLEAAANSPDAIHAFYRAIRASDLGV